MENLLEIKDLSVDIDGTSILDLKGRTIAIDKGDVIGIIGENGAGKSTLINCIIDKIQYSGCIKKNFSVDELGIQFQINSYNKLMKVYELIQIETKKIKFDERFEKELSQFEIKQLLKKKIGKLSVGELQRLTLFLVLYLEPNVLMFDELTTGLDYQKRTELLELVKEYSKNKTVLTITHYFEEISNWANKLLILHKGHLVFFGTFDELKDLYEHFSIIKVTSEIKGDLKEVCSKNTLQIDLGEKHVGIVAYNEKQQNLLVEKLSKKGVRFQIEPQGIYSLYTLAIKSPKKE